MTKRLQQMGCSVVILSALAGAIIGALIPNPIVNFFTDEILITNVFVCGFIALIISNIVATFTVKIDSIIPNKCRKCEYKRKVTLHPEHEWERLPAGIDNVWFTCSNETARNTNKCPYGSPVKFTDYGGIERK